MVDEPACDTSVIPTSSYFYFEVIKLVFVSTSGDGDWFWFRIGISCWRCGRGTCVEKSVSFAVLDCKSKFFSCFSFDSFHLCAPLNWTRFILVLWVCKIQKLKEYFICILCGNQHSNTYHNFGFVLLFSERQNGNRRKPTWQFKYKWQLNITQLKYQLEMLNTNQIERRNQKKEPKEGNATYKIKILNIRINNTQSIKISILTFHY